MNMWLKLDEIEAQFAELEEQLSLPEIYQDPKKYSQTAKAHAALADIVHTYRVYKQVLAEQEEHQELILDSDPEIRELAKTELEAAQKRFRTLKANSRACSYPKTLWTINRLSWRLGLEPEEKRLLSLPGICCACIPGMPKQWAGKLNY